MKGIRISPFIQPEPVLTPLLVVVTSALLQGSAQSGLSGEEGSGIRHCQTNGDHPLSGPQGL